MLSAPHLQPALRHLLAPAILEFAGALAAVQVNGAERVMHSMHGSPIAAVKLFSSIAACLGSGGQANYAAANAILDAHASALQTQVKLAGFMSSCRTPV